MVVEGGGIDNHVAFQPFWKQLFGHVVFVKAFAGRLGPTRVTADTIFDFFFAQVNDLNFRLSFSHPVDKMIKHEFSFAPTASSGAGIDCQYFHTVRLS